MSHVKVCRLGRKLWFRSRTQLIYSCLVPMEHLITSTFLTRKTHVWVARLSTSLYSPEFVILFVNKLGFLRDPKLNVMAIVPSWIVTQHAKNCLTSQASRQRSETKKTGASGPRFTDTPFDRLMNMKSL